MSVWERQVLQDVGRLALKWDRRPRPWPWDITADLTCTANVAPNVFGNRLVVMAAGAPGFTLWIPTVPMNVDVNTMYASVKSRVGGSAVTFSLGVGRHMDLATQVPESTGAFPTG